MMITAQLEKTELPKTHEEFTDKYFLRSKEILENDNLNPFVRAQVFIRKGPGNVHGIEQALEVLEKYSNIRENGHVYALPEGSRYDSTETLMVIEAPIQDIITLETMYLGLMTEATTLANGGKPVNLENVTERMAAVVKAADGIPVSYFGARHWGFSMDADIAWHAYLGGAETCSTDAGSARYGSKGMGTIPHALENIYAWMQGSNNAVVEAVKAFDRHMDKSIPRIALIDYNNKEVDDAVASAVALEGRLYGVRIDTCGENVAQGAAKTLDDVAEVLGKEVCIPKEHEKYWAGSGVTVTGVYAVRKALDEAGYEDVKIILSSGFGKPQKVEAFVEASKRLGRNIVDGFGVGGVYDSMTASMDIVAVGDTIDTMTPVCKVGRGYKPNDRLVRYI